MNEKRMRTPVNTGEVSLLPVQGAVWSVKIDAAHGDGTEKRRLGTPDLLANPCDGGNIVETTSKTQTPRTLGQMGNPG